MWQSSEELVADPRLGGPFIGFHFTRTIMKDMLEASKLFHGHNRSVRRTDRPTGQKAILSH